MEAFKVVKFEFILVVAIGVGLESLLEVWIIYFFNIGSIFVHKFGVDGGQMAI